MVTKTEPSLGQSQIKSSWSTRIYDSAATSLKKVTSVASRVIGLSDFVAAAKSLKDHQWKSGALHLCEGTAKIAAITMVVCAGTLLYNNLSTSSSIPPVDIPINCDLELGGADFYRVGTREGFYTYARQMTFDSYTLIRQKIGPDALFSPQAKCYAILTEQGRAGITHMLSGNSCPFLRSMISSAPTILENSRGGVLFWKLSDYLSYLGYHSPSVPLLQG